MSLKKDESSKGRPPEYIAYLVKDIEAIQGGVEGEKRWIAIGAAWLHKDAVGLNITLDALPVDGRLVLRENKKAQSS